MRAILERVTQDDALEARWLNTVSMMEHIGARKISRTVAASHPSVEVLEHLADETRHALAFKQLACTLQGDGGEPDYLCPAAAVTYFKHLDEAASGWIAARAGQRDMWGSYLLVTTLIERRAMRLYPLYKSLTRHEVVRDEVQRVILEEANHRKVLESRALAHVRALGVEDLSECVAMEEALMEGFARAVRQELAM